MGSTLRRRGSERRIVEVIRVKNIEHLRSYGLNFTDQQRLSFRHVRQFRQIFNRRINVANDDREPVDKVCSTWSPLRNVAAAIRWRKRHALSITRGHFDSLGVDNAPVFGSRQSDCDFGLCLDDLAAMGKRRCRQCE